MRSSTSRSFLGKCTGLVCCKTGGGAGYFVGGARTIIIIVHQTEVEEQVDLNRDHRFSRDTEMPTSDISFQKNNDAVARLAVYIG